MIFNPRTTKLGQIILSFCLLMIASGSLACAQDIGNCVTQSNAPAGVAACTTVIQSSSLSGHELALAYDSRGSAFAASGEYARAIADYTRALELDPKFVDALVNRALAYNATQQYELASADANKAIQINPDFSLAYFSRAYTLAQEQKYDLAISDYDKILDSNPTNRLALQSRAAAYFGSGKYSQSIADYTQVIQMNPSDPSLYSNRGRDELMNGDLADAIRDFASAVSYNRANPYYALWLQLARNRAGTPQLGEFLANTAGLDPSKWPAPIARFYAGKESTAAVFAAASDVGEKCEAYFYIAEFNIASHRQSLGKGQLQKASAICPRNYVESGMARAELLRVEH
jgi:tetratricopeptide (TPR) repeat protein